LSDLLGSDDPRVRLAADRTVLAAERTYAAWVRTGIAAMIAGVGAHAVDELVWSPELAMVTGTLLMAFAAFCFAAGLWRQLNLEAPITSAGIRPLPRALVIGANGALILIALASMAGLLAAG